MTKIGNPVRLFYNDNVAKFEDVTGEIITVPEQTLWLTSDITDENAIKEIDNLELVAYSITVSEKEDADLVMNIFNNIATKEATKGTYDDKVLNDLHERISSKRTLIADIEDPVMLTTSLVKFPCVNKARFCKKSLENNYKSNGETMANKDSTDANSTFIDELKASVNKYRKNMQKKDEEGETMNKEEINSIVEEKMGAMKEEITTQMDSQHDELLTAIKKLTSPEITDDEKNIISNDEQNNGTQKTPTEPKSTGEKSETNDDTGIVEKPGKSEKSHKHAGHGGKSYKHEKPLREDEGTPSAQSSRKDARLEDEGDKKMSIKRDEFAYIDEQIKNARKNKFITKSVPLETISYETTGLTPYNRKYMNLIEDPIMRNVYKNSFTFKEGFTIDETNTRRAIFNTNIFTSYITRIIQDEPLLQDVTYQTGLYGKGHIYELDDTITTEDGALSEHYYFDKNVAEKQATITNREIETYPQRTKVNISDRQRLANVYGDDLVNILLDRTVKRLKRGVAVARFYGNTSLSNSVDLQFRRQNGYLKEAGQQLTSADVNLDKITDVFDTMFYALPEEAQIESECIFYVPTNIKRAYGNYFLDKAGDRAYDIIQTRNDLYWQGQTPIKLSPTLNDAPMRTLLDAGNVSVLLIKPNNTHFVVGREAGIEPKRYAETSSDAYYATIDTANAYAINDYAVRLSLTADEYAGLIGNADEEEDEP